MKKLFAAILALGLIVAVSGTASAVDVKFGGSYYLVGVYDSNPSLREDAYSRAYFWQRIRIEPVFKIAEGLTFTARMDAMEKQWGNASWQGAEDVTLSRQINPVNNAKIQESFEWERGYVNFLTGFGEFQIGYQAAGAYGTVFGDNTTTRPRIVYKTKAGPILITALFEKYTEANKNIVLGDGLTDAEADAVALSLVYPFKGGMVGMLNVYKNDASLRSTQNLRRKTIVTVPFVKATFGPVYFEAEVDHIGGQFAEYEAPATNADVDAESWSAYAMAKTKMGPLTVGGQFGWAKGDPDGAADGKMKGLLGGGTDWNPALILMNDDLGVWTAGGVFMGGDRNSSESGKNNMLLLNAFLTYAVTPKIELGGAATYAKADNVAAGWDKDRGYEFDVTATYKIYDNLTYMVGAGYLFAGDYYKMGVATANVDNDYLLINKLTLSF